MNKRIIALIIAAVLSIAMLAIALPSAADSGADYLITGKAGETLSGGYGV